MKVRSTVIADEFAEAFPMRFARLVITAADDYWLQAAVDAVSGYACSVIGCDAEAGVDRRCSTEISPDGRIGAELLFFGMSSEALGKALVNRVGQCLMTCPTISVFDGLPSAEKRVPLGKQLRYFGDGFQKSKKLNGRRFWRVPVMDGEFVVEDQIGLESGVAGGNLILQGRDATETLRVATLAARQMQEVTGIIAPFPAGVVRSGSKVGSRYASLFASTNEAYCPSLAGRVESQLHPDANCAYEIVVDGVSQDAIAQAMVKGMEVAIEGELLEVTAGNYGGKLGPFHFRLHDLTSQLFVDAAGGKHVS